MNTIDDNDRNHLRYAEYVLGVLDADARAAVAHEVATLDEAAVAVARWQRHLASLAYEAPAQEPPAEIWQRISQSLRLEQARSRPPVLSTTRWWDNLRLWQWIGAGAIGVAAACLVVVLQRPTTPPQEQVHGISLMVSSIHQENGVAGWTATMDLQRKQIVVVPATPSPVAANRSTELWLIPQGGKPIAVGVFQFDATTTLPLSPALLSQLGPTAVLAVSVEPSGGSPTGQPTGPVIGKGNIAGAPEGKDGQPVAHAVEPTGNLDMGALAGKRDIG
ncbi:anti-sigma factor [Dyella sp.]|uniref:anti-sigma factor n=1 Tax=Dyella sp. TaxID=1869338 RepID=UPI002ED5EF1D